MDQVRRFGRKTRWSVPVGAVAVAGMVIAGSMIASAQAAPALPARTAAQLLADIADSSAPPSALSGVIVESASLGLPQMPDAATGSSAYSLLAGSHTIDFWYAGRTQVRIAVPVQMGETDLRRDGRQVWLWDSRSDTATHIVLPVRPVPSSAVPWSAAPGSAAASSAAASSAAAGSAAPSSAAPRSHAASYSGFLPLTPQQAARQVLAAVGPTTMVSVQQNVTVAGQAAYQLAIAPKDSRSLVGQITIAVDAHGYLPLRLQVFARGATSPAYQVGFTSVSFARPAASNFTFTPPPGATVKNSTIPGIGWHGFRPGGPPRKFVPRRSGHPGFWSGSPPGAVPSAVPTVIGKGWLSVIAFASAASTATVNGTTFRAVLRDASSSHGVTTTGQSAAYASTLTISGPAGEAPAIPAALLRSATPVHGAWGSGRLLRTSLLSVLVTSDGRVLLGAVTPSVLYADVAKVK